VSRQGSFVRALAGSLLAAVATGLVPGTVQAQTPSASRPAVQQGNQAQQPQQPYRGLFGAGSPARPGGHTLDLSLSVYQEYGNTADEDTPAGVIELGTGWFTGARGTVSLERAGQRARFGLRSEASLRYYQETRETTSPRVRVLAAVDGTESRGRDTNWHLDGSFDYEPYYVLPLFGGQAPVTGGTAILPTSRDDIQYANRRAVFGQSFSVDRQVSSRWTIGVFEDFRYTKSENELYDVRAIHAGARLGRRFSRYAALRLGYAYRLGEYGANTDQRLEAHDIDISLDYRRPLPRLRRTTIGFSTGSSRMAQPEARWDVVGAASLRHEFDQGWFLQGEFARNARIVEGFASPFFENTAAASLGGFFGRRVEVLASGGYSRGEVGFTSDRYRAIQGAARLRLALARFLAVDVEGLTNRHTFDAGIVVPETLPPSMNRWSVRCNVMVWLPLSR
jgi:hypothetical protein